jgi:hypothetical protein
MLKKLVLLPLLLILLLLGYASATSDALVPLQASLGHVWHAWPQDAAAAPKLLAGSGQNLQHHSKPLSPLMKQAFKHSKIPTSF